MKITFETSTFFLVGSAAVAQRVMTAVDRHARSIIARNRARDQRDADAEILRRDPDAGEEAAE